jgi:hypothetical protein
MFLSAGGGIIFLKFLVLGLVFGAASSIVKLVNAIFKNNIVIVNMCWFIFFAVLGGAHTILILKICSGKILAYTFFATILGLILAKITIVFFFTKLGSMVYNILAKMLVRIKNTKVGGKILR